jgi:hypothetical protein
MAVPPHREHGVEALSAAHALHVASDDLVGGLQWLPRRARARNERNRQNEEEEPSETAHRAASKVWGID